MESQEEKISKPKLIPLSKWNEFHAWPSISGMRNLISKNEDNNFGRCIIRVGRRIVVDEGKFFEWVNSHRSNQS